MKTTVCLFLLALPLVAPVWAQDQGSGEVSVVRFPPNDVGVGTLEIRKDLQLKTRGQFEVFHDFTFSDRVDESGITFVHQITEDTAREFIPVHYDHGNGIAVADVDGDGLYDLYLLSQLGSNELWKNMGGGKFQNITEQAGVGVADRVTVTASFADVDNDGDPDLYVTTARMGNVFFRNDGRGRFTDISKETGLDHTGHSSGAVFFDYDLDGLLDCYLTNVGVYTIDQMGPGPYWIGRADAFEGHKFPERTESSILFRNLGNLRMEDVSEKVNLVDGGWTGDAAFVDLNEDGYPDLYVMNMQGQDHYYENVEGKSFVEKAKELFPRNPWGAMGIKFFDYNNDGLMDLYLTDMHSDMIEHIGIEREYLKARIPQDDPAKFLSGNAFWKNLGEGRFVEVSDEIGVENYWPWGMSVEDVNADGWDDIFVTSSMSYPFRYGINSMFLNNRGKEFLDSEFILGIEPRSSGETHVPWFRLDCDGEDKTHHHCESEGRTGQVEIWSVLGTRTSVMFDLDEDGDLDIVTGDFGSRPQVLISDLAQKRDIKYLKIELVGTKSNRDGLGALVKVVAGGQEYVKMNDGKSGYLTQSSLPIYFGLGDAKSVDRVEVKWPSGRTQTLTENLPINDLLVIEEVGD
jgi:hypothetical protein